MASSDGAEGIALTAGVAVGSVAVGVADGSGLCSVSCSVLGKKDIEDMIIEMKSLMTYSDPTS